MANPYVIIDHIIKDEGVTGNYTISFAELQEEDRQAIANWIKECQDGCCEGYNGR